MASKRENTRNMKKKKKKIEEVSWWGKFSFSVLLSFECSMTRHNFLSTRSSYLDRRNFLDTSIQFLLYVYTFWKSNVLRDVFKYFSPWCCTVAPQLVVQLLSEHFWKHATTQDEKSISPLAIKRDYPPLISFDGNKNKKKMAVSIHKIHETI